MEKKKTKQDINKEILGQLVKIDKTLKQDVKVSVKENKLKTILFAFTFGSSFILFAYGLSQYFDWNNFILTGIWLFISSIVVFANWD